MIEVPITFKLFVSEQEGNPNAGYTHRCDVMLFNVEMWRIWGKSAEEAEAAGRRELSARLRGVLKSRG